MNLNDLRTANRFDVMTQLHQSNSISKQDSSEAIKILLERDIGIPKELFYQEYLYRAETEGTGLKGYFTGTQSLAKCLTLWFSISAVVAALLGGYMLVVGFQAAIGTAIHVGEIVGAIAMWCIFMCRNNSQSDGLYIVSLISVAAYILYLFYDIFKAVVAIVL